MSISHLLFGYIKNLLFLFKNGQFFCKMDYLRLFICFFGFFFLNLQPLILTSRIKLMQELRIFLHRTPFIGQFIVLLLLLLYPKTVAAQATDSLTHDTLKGTARVAFSANQAILLPDNGNNWQELMKIKSVLDRVHTDTTLTLQRVTIQGYSSPEGSYASNERLARERADSLKVYVERYADVPSSFIETSSTPEDWAGLEAFVLGATPQRLPHRDALLQIIRSSQSPDDKERALRQQYPADFSYLVENCMPLLRRADYSVWYVKTNHIAVPQTTGPVFTPQPARPDTLQAMTLQPALSRPSWFALKTNLLYDAALIPNIGIEISLGKHWSVAADWFYTWFSCDNRHRYWQGYGGYLAVRRYFPSKKAVQSSRNFTGHHLGIYALGLTYDVEWGGRGYQAARFGFGGGVEYGYSMPIGRRLNLDFSIGLGFQDGEYKEYLPMDDHYVWQATHKRHWWGPTKAEISLVWLLGHGKGKKGGADE